MKCCMSLRMLTGLLVGFAGFSLAMPIAALPQVESRTGEPVTRHGESSPTMPETFHGHPPDPGVSAYSNPQTTTSSHPVTPSYPSASSSPTHAPLQRTPRSAAEQQRAARLTLTQVDALQREVSELRGLVEMQDHEMKQLKKSQQDLYKDLERRLSELSSKSTTKSSQPKSEISANVKSSKNKESTKSTASTPTSSLYADKQAAGDKPGEMMVIQSNVDSEEQALMEEMIINAESKPETKAQTEPKIAAKASNGSDSGSESPGWFGSKKKTGKGVQDTKSSVDTKSAETKNVSKPTPTTANADIGVIPTSKSHSASVTDNNTYQSAYNLIRTKKYNEGANALLDYLKRFPKGEQAANAHYWLGEVYMVQWQTDKSKSDLLEKATQEFLNVVNQFPSHAKVSDAVLKLGLIELEKGNIEAARLHLLDVKTRFRGTAAAKVADARLNQLKD